MGQSTGLLLLAEAAFQRCPLIAVSMHTSVYSGPCRIVVFQ